MMYTVISKLLTGYNLENSIRQAVLVWKKHCKKWLYLAGDCAGPARGVGTELVCQSGIDCADLIARDFKASKV